MAAIARGWLVVETAEGDRRTALLTAQQVERMLEGVGLNTATAHGMYAFAGETFDEPRTASPDDVLTTFCGYDLGESLADMCDDVAREMVRAMPWHETIVIDCC